MKQKWADPISVRMAAEKEKQLRELAEKKGLSPGLYIRGLIYEHLDKEAA